MGEKQTIEIASRLLQGEPICTLTDIKGTLLCRTCNEYKPGPAVECPSYEQVCQSKREYAISCRKQQDEQDAVRGKKLIQRHGDMIVVQNHLCLRCLKKNFDKVYELPFERGGIIQVMKKRAAYLPFRK